MAKKSAIAGEYIVNTKDDGGIEVYRIYDNAKEALREIAEKEGFEYDKKWTTRQLGSKIIDFINEKKVTLRKIKENPEQDTAKSEKAKTLNRVLVTDVFQEIEYIAYDFDGHSLDSFCYREFSAPGNVEVTVDGVLIDDEDVIEELGNQERHTEYVPENLWEFWGTDNIATIESYAHEVHEEWEFEVEDFDITKLVWVNNQYDVILNSEGYSVEGAIASLEYDGKELESSRSESDGDFYEEIYNVNKCDECED